MSTRGLVETFEAWRDECDALVLMTVVATAGSTYSKTGRQLLMRPDGTHAGLVSGGCLEGDLAAHAKRVFETGVAEVVTYDMRDDADDLWGIGLGCNGLMQLLLQKISAQDNWQPFAAIATALSDADAHTINLITESDNAELSPGDAFIDREAPANVTCAQWETQPWIRLLVLGGAPDAVPVVRLARQLGWQTTIADHRPHYLDSNDFSLADQVQLVDPDKLASSINPADYHAIVIMSHHLETDGKYLRQLVDAQPAYIGLLGPAARKQKLLERVGADNDLAPRLHGPVGLNIGADSPESIALALVSEIQAVIAANRNPG